jgi:hypothetical protein
MIKALFPETCHQAGAGFQRQDAEDGDVVPGELVFKVD